MSSDNTLVFTIGRMNPPTPGHMALIEKLIHRAAALGQTKIGIILSHSQDMPKNPFNCDDKRKMLLAGMIDALKIQMKQKIATYNPPISLESIDAIEPIIICMDDPMPSEFGKHPILKSVNALLAHYSEPVHQAFLIVGQDRAGGYEFVKEALGRRGIELDDSDFLVRPEGAISATHMRELAYSGNWDEFLAIYSATGIPEENIRAIYEGLRGAMAAAASGSKKKGKGKGGRRTKKRNSKRTKKSKKNKKTKRHYK
jgi:hypothetical protein